MSEYVRVRDKDTGHHLSLLRSQVDRNPDAWQELKQPATYADGTPLPAKHKTTVDASAAAKKQHTNDGRSADTEKEH